MKIQTYSGTMFDFDNIESNEIDIIDIAHSLAMQCRWQGHTKFHYSVAQHSVYVSRCVNEKYALQGLLHDAAEAYIGDIPTPLKSTLELGNLEERILDHIFKQLKVDLFPISLEVKTTDERMLATEANQLLPPIENPSWSAIAYFFPIDEWTPKEASLTFLSEFLRLKAYDLPYL